MIHPWPANTYILIPSYQSADRLGPFLRDLLTAVPAGRVCVVDDGSTDGTVDVCARVNVTCLSHGANAGKGAALRTGFAHLAGGAEWVITMDADGQHSPDDLPLFLEAQKLAPAGLCIGARDMRLGVMPPARIISNRLTSAILSILAWRRIRDSQCGYRMYPRELIASIHIEYDRFQMESEIILKAAAKKFSIRFVPVRTLYLRGGSSHIAHFADTARWAAAVVKVWLGIKSRGKNLKR